MTQLIYTSVLLIITLRFTCGRRKICSAIRKFQNIISMIYCKVFFCFLCLNSFNCQRQSYFGWNLLYLSKKRPRPIWTSVKRPGKWLSSKTNFSTFLQISCSNFKLKLLEWPVRSKKLFPETNIHKNIWDKHQFSCEIKHYEKSPVSVFQEIFISIDKIFIYGEVLTTM